MKRRRGEPHDDSDDTSDDREMLESTERPRRRRLSLPSSSEGKRRSQGEEEGEDALETVRALPQYMAPVLVF